MGTATGICGQTRADGTICTNAAGCRIPHPAGSAASPRAPARRGLDGDYGAHGDGSEYLSRLEVAGASVYAHPPFRMNVVGCGLHAVLPDGRSIDLGTLHLTGATRFEHMHLWSDASDAKKWVAWRDANMGAEDNTALVEWKNQVVRMLREWDESTKHISHLTP